MICYSDYSLVEAGAAAVTTMMISAEIAASEAVVRVALAGRQLLMTMKAGIRTEFRAARGALWRAKHCCSVIS